MDKYMGRKVIVEKSFKAEGTFESMYAAESFLNENGYGYGSSCAMYPIPIMKGDYYSYDLPHKWKNFTDDQKKIVDGVMTGDLRDGPVFIYLFN